LRSTHPHTSRIGDIGPLNRVGISVARALGKLFRVLDEKKPIGSETSQTLKMTRRSGSTEQFEVLSYLNLEIFEGKK
jgi:hypothetical protein